MQALHLLALQPIPETTADHKWLKSGFVERGNWFPTIAGTPQGGIASPTLANMTLDGMEALLEKRFGAKSSRKGRQNKVNFIRYADDFVSTGATEEILVEACRWLQKAAYTWLQNPIAHPKNNFFRVIRI